MSEILQLFTFFLFTFLGLELAFYSTNYAKTYKYVSGDTAPPWADNTYYSCKEVP